MGPGLLVLLMAILMLCRVGVQPPTVAEEGACLGESAPGARVGSVKLGWVLASHGADISVDSP